MNNLTKLITKNKNLVLLTAIIAITAGVLSSYLTFSYLENNKTKEDRIADFYKTETAAHVSPHGLRKALDKGDDSFLLVDLRSAEEYEKEHIVGAVNIPAYSDPDTSAYGDVERIVSEFEKLPKDKDIIVYCYSIPCMTGRKMGAMLAEHDIYVKLLGVGWNEWRHYWTLWNHEHEWEKTNAEDYVVSGKDPGTPKIKEDSDSCPIENEFGC